MGKLVQINKEIYCCYSMVNINIKEHIPTIFALVVLAAAVLGLVTSGQDMNPNNQATVGKFAVEKYQCRTCHIVDGDGGDIGPDLTGIMQRYDDLTLHQWLERPQGVKPGTSMPSFHFSDAQVDSIIAYFHWLER